MYLTPIEFFVALHNLEFLPVPLAAETSAPQQPEAGDSDSKPTSSGKVDLKHVLRAVNLCFAERRVFTSDVVQSAIEQLLQLSQLPTPLMRTLLQALTVYPKLSHFAVGVLQRLLAKQVHITSVLLILIFRSFAVIQVSTEIHRSTVLSCRCGGTRTSGRDGFGAARRRVRRASRLCCSCRRHNCAECWIARRSCASRYRHTCAA